MTELPELRRVQLGNHILTTELQQLRHVPAKEDQETTEPDTFFARPTLIE